MRPLRLGNWVTLLVNEARISQGAIHLIICYLVRPITFPTDCMNEGSVKQHICRCFMGFKMPCGTWDLLTGPTDMAQGPQSNHTILEEDLKLIWVSNLWVISNGMKCLFVSCLLEMQSSINYSGAEMSVCYKDECTADWRHLYFRVRCRRPLIDIWCHFRCL